MTSPIGKPRHDQMAPAGDAPDNERLVPDAERIVPDAGTTAPGDDFPVPDDERLVLTDDPDVLVDDRVVLDQDDSAARTSARDTAESTSVSARWPEILAMFVDDPRASVELAAGLTDDSVQALIASVKERQHALLSAWQGTDTGTEDLRTTLQAYRRFWNHVDAFAQTPE
jgi:hypothetical protein